MSINPIRKFRRTIRRFQHKFSPEVLILLYHRVIELPSDPHEMCVTPENFSQQLEFLQKYYHPISLQQLICGFENRDLPPRAVVITFDDGYADNLHNAKPLLERFDIPAIFFLTAGYIGCDREFWWDDLERVLLLPGKLPESLYLKINGTAHRWNLGKAADYSQAECNEHRSWISWEEDNPSYRHSLYQALYQLLQPLPEGERRIVLNDILQWAGAGPTARPAYRPLSEEEVYSLERGGVIEIGAHTMTHPLLSAFSADLQGDEILQSKTQLEALLNHPVTSFSYPYGGRNAYTMETVAKVQEAGFTSAFSNFAGLAWQGSDLFQLPRIQVQNQDGEEFARLLSGWFDG